MGKFYAVVSGRVPGIYDTWREAEENVKGYPGAIYKSFYSREDADAFIKASTNVNINQAATPQTLPLIDKTLIYTDGSCSDNVCGFGVIIIQSNGEKTVAYGQVPAAVHPNGGTNNIAELYAIYVALSLVQKGDIVLYSDSEYAISCLTTRIHDWIRNGWNGISNKTLIEGTHSLTQNRIVIFQHVRGHSKHPLNTEADLLAKLGRTGIDNLIIEQNGKRLQL